MRKWENLLFIGSPVGLEYMYYSYLFYLYIVPI